MNPYELRMLLNQPVTLYFSDGEIVETVLLGVDTKVDRDITYEVVKIVQRGVPAARGTVQGGTCVASVDELLKWQATSRS